MEILTLVRTGTVKQKAILIIALDATCWYMTELGHNTLNWLQMWFPKSKWDTRRQRTQAIPYVFDGLQRFPLAIDYDHIIATSWHDNYRRLGDIDLVTHSVETPSMVTPSGIYCAEGSN